MLELLKRTLNQMIKRLSSRQIHQNQWLSLREDQVSFNEKTTGVYTVVDKPDFALIVPYDGKFLYLVKQFRYPLGIDFIEFPSGSHEEKDLSQEFQLAKDELREETGLSSQQISKVGILREVPGLINQQCHLFYATNLIQGEQELEATEADLQVIKLTPAEFEKQVSCGEICDCKTIAAYYLCRNRFNSSESAPTTPRLQK